MTLLEYFNFKIYTKDVIKLENLIMYYKLNAQNVVSATFNNDALYFDWEVWMAKFPNFKWNAD